MITDVDEIAQEPMSAPGAVAVPDLTAVRARVTDLEQQARSLIRQRPVVAVLAAAGFGYLMARVVVRGTR